MIAHAVAVAWVVANAPLVAAEFERARLRDVCVAHPASASCSATVDPKTMPTPSTAWIDSWVTMARVSPLLSDVRAELAHGLLWSFGESRYQDKPPRSDSGKGVCSFGVHFAFTPWTAEQLEDDPNLCILAARSAMLWSRNLDADHPMSGYAGCGKKPCAVADWRASLLKDVLAKLPPLKEP